MADKKKKTEKKDSVKASKEVKKTVPAKQKAAKTVSTSPKKAAPAKKVVPTKTAAVKKPASAKKSSSSSKSIEQEVKEAAVALGHTAQKVWASAVKKAKEVAKNIDVQEVVHDIEVTGKKALSGAKKVANQVGKSQVVSQALHTGEGWFSGITRWFSSWKASKTFDSALKTGKWSVAQLVEKVKPEAKKERTHTILGVELSDTTFRTMVLIWMLMLFFLFGMFVWKISTYNHIAHQLRMYEENQQRMDFNETVPPSSTSIVPQWEPILPQQVAPTQLYPGTDIPVVDSVLPNQVLPQ